MAHLDRKDAIYLARFRFGGKEYKRSLKTADKRDAEAAINEIQRAIHRLTIGLIQVPPGIDVGDFILSGGTLTDACEPEIEIQVPSLEAAVRRAAPFDLPASRSAWSDHDVVLG